MRSAAGRRLARLLRDRSGRLYELPVLIMVLGAALAVAVPAFVRHGLLRGVLAFVLTVAAVLGGFAALILAALGVGRVLESGPARAARAFLERPAAAAILRALGALIAALLSGVGAGAFALLIVGSFAVSDRVQLAVPFAVGVPVFGLVLAAFAAGARRSPRAS